MNSIQLSKIFFYQFFELVHFDILINFIIKKNINKKLFCF